MPGVSLPEHALSLSSLRVFWVGTPSRLEDVFSFYFLNKTELEHGAVTLICPRPESYNMVCPRAESYNTVCLRAVTC